MRQPGLTGLALFLGYVCGSLLLIAAALDTVHCQTPTAPPASTPQQSVMDGMLKACNSLADEIETARRLIKAQQDEIKAAAEALAASKQAHIEKDTKLDLQTKTLTQKDETLKATEGALSAQKTATTEAVHALNTERVKSGFYKKLAAGAIAVAIIAVYAAGH